MSDAAQNSSPTPTSATGPRTEAGKRRSRSNARIHGLTAKLPNCEAEAALMQQFADRWTKELAPDTEAETALIRSSAMAYARIERYRKIEEGTLRGSAVDAVARWEKKKRHGVRALAQKLAADPSNTVADLESTSFGCEWLMRQWRKLDAKLAQGVLWESADMTLAMRLRGDLPTGIGPDADEAIREVGLLCLGAMGLSKDGKAPLGETIRARADFRRFIAEEVERLDALRQEAWDDADSLEAEAVAQAGMAETTKDGQLRRRYAKEAFSEMTRGIALVIRIRRERSRLEDREWAQAHPTLRRGSGTARPITEHHAPPCLKPSTRPSADPRNEPPSPAPDAADPRLNPNAENEMRREPSPSSPALDRRSEPRFTPTIPPTTDRLTPECPTTEGPRTVSDPALTA